MSSRRNLADPTYEPSDEDLGELMAAAFGPLEQERERSLREMRDRIARMQREVRARFASRSGHAAALTSDDP